MTALTPPLDLVTTAVLELLRGADRPVYDGAFDGDPLAPDYWYSILYAVPGGDADAMPDLDDENDTVTVPFQVSTVSDLRNEAQAGARVLHDRLLARSRVRDDWAFPLVMPDGWQCIGRRPDPSLPGVERTGAPPNAIFTVPARYLLTISPT